MTKEELIKLREEILKTGNINLVENFFKKMSAYQYLYECNKDRLDCLAINYLGNKITYRQLFEMIDNSAKAFDELGVKAGDSVSASLLAIPEGIVTFYALDKLGATVHMVNPASSKIEITKFINSVNSKVYVTMDLFYSNEMKKAIDETQINKIVMTSLTNSLPMGINLDNALYNIITGIKRTFSAVKKDDKCIMWDDFYKKGINSTKNITPYFELNRNAAIAYTSGSTGISKAVVATNEAINAMPIQLGMSDQTFAPNDIIFNSLPLWIYYSLINNIHNPLCLGVALALDPLFNAKNIDKRLKQYRFNHWNTIPAYVEDMCNNKKIEKMDLNYLKSITTGGDFLTPQLKEKADKILSDCNSNVKVGQGYGASEVLGSFSYTYDKNYTIGSVGKPLVGNKIKILDVDTNKELDVNQTGELYLCSPTIMKEYHGNEEATQEVIVTDENGIKWYKTGDLAHINEKGELFIDGRIRRIVLTKDENGFPTKIIPDKVKKELLNNNIIEKCEVITVPDSETVNKAVAYVVLKNTEQDNEKIVKDLKIYCSKHVPSYMVPRDIKVVDEIPLTPSLKPDWNKMEEMYNEDLSNDKIKIKKRI